MHATEKFLSHLTANSENNSPDTIILAWEEEMDRKDWILMHTEMH